ncbi:MAG: leucine-rich repeat domain-containing protein [Bacteroidales bacterium]|nr:leucine-rich repeat domain-containing protein [Bacteroidales bacterium]
MKHLLLSIFTLATICLTLPCYAYDFSAVSPSGHTLYYTVVNGEATVVTPSPSGYGNNFTGNLVVPDSVLSNGITYPITAIGVGAFQYCHYLTGVTIPNTVTAIGSDAFYSCSSLVSMIVSTGNPVYDSRNSCNAIIETSSNTLMFGCRSTIIPNTVTAIGNLAFSGCSSLTNISIPNSVTSIGNGAFSGCTSLLSVNISNSVTSIGQEAFWNCSTLTGITIPNSVTTIGDRAFKSCTNMVSFNIPTSVTAINNGTFYGCLSLASIDIPNSVTVIGNSAFSSCRALTNISIPSSVFSIGENAFNECTLDTVSLFWEIPISQSLANASQLLSNTNVFSIPCGSMYYYTLLWDNSWNSHNYLERGVDFQLDISAQESTWGTASIIPQDGSNIRCSDSTAIIQATANDGYRFSHWSNGDTVNPDTLHLVGDSSVTAIFAPIIGVEEMAMSDLQVYIRDGQVILNGECAIRDVQIYDISGKLLKTVKVEGDHTVVDISHFAAGVYIVHTDTTNGHVIRKVAR